MELVTFSVIATNALVVWELFCYGRSSRADSDVDNGGRPGQRRSPRLGAEQRPTLASAWLPSPPSDSREHRLPATGYAAALIELCGCIWQDLERFDERLQRLRITESASGLLWLAATLRLELLLLSDSLSAERWRPMLTREQSEALRSVVADVLAIIAVTPDELTLRVIERAQDRLFDEVLGAVA